METNRRRFSRIHFDTPAELGVKPDLCVGVKVLDLSLRGALVEIVGPPLPQLTHDVACSLAINLDGETDFLEGGILMNMVIAHIHDNVVGLRCVEIDLDSITNLRRVVEFNLGDEAILSRELEYLSYGEP